MLWLSCSEAPLETLLLGIYSWSHLPETLTGPFVGGSVRGREGFLREMGYIKYKCFFFVSMHG